MLIPSLLVLIALTPPDPVRVWRTDSIAYVTLREPGHLLLLHVDPTGRINVLFPFGPYDGTAIAGGVAFDVPLPPVAQGSPASFVAVRSRWPFDFAALQAESGWNYSNALLLQPTGGDPLAALLEIADRVTDGRPYDYGVVEYLRGGTVAAARREPLQPSVCLSCVRRGTAVAAAPPQVATNSVDCSNATLTNSFCGVNSGTVSITSGPQGPSQPAPAAAAAVYVPYYLPIVVNGGRRRFEHNFRPPPPPPAPRSSASAFPIAPRLVVPSRAQVRSFGGRRP